MSACPIYSYEHSCIQQWTTHLNELLVGAGVIFWQWGFAPYVSAEFLEGCIHCQAIQVSSSDGVFKNIIAPAADYSHKIALSRSPVAECSAGTDRTPCCCCYSWSLHTCCAPLHFWSSCVGYADASLCEVRNSMCVLQQHMLQYTVVASKDNLLMLLTTLIRLPLAMYQYGGRMQVHICTS